MRGGEKRKRRKDNAIDEDDKPLTSQLTTDHEAKTDGTWTGRGIAQSSFHHLVDYNWDVAKGAPSSVAEKPGHEVERNPEGLSGIRQYVKNAVSWLSRDAE